MKQIKTLRWIALTEGVSFLFLLLIAMPLKYYFGQPELVKWTGWIHGILFMAYIAFVFLCVQAMRWNWFNTLVALAASLVPLGTFFLDKSFRRRLTELESRV
ncbi:MAG: DUF3817 domain-containing protein [Bacteroidota bacterium]